MLRTIYQSYAIYSLQDFNLEIFVFVQMKNVKLNSRQVNFEDMHWNQLSQCTFQAFYDAFYKTLILITEPF